MSADAVRGLARDLAAAPSAAVHGRMGVSTQAHGVVCQWAVQTINILTGNLDRPGGTMLTTPAVDLIGRGVLGPGGFGTAPVAGARAAVVRGRAAGVGAGGGDHHPGRGPGARAADHRGQPGVVDAVRAPARRGAGRPRRDGVDRLLRQRDHPARRRHPAADRAARARPLRHRLPPARGARHRPVVPGPVRSRSRARGPTGRSRATSAPPCSASGPTGCATGGRGPPCRPRPGCGSARAGSSTRCCGRPGRGCRWPSSRGWRPVPTVARLKPRLPERLATADQRIDLATPLVLDVAARAARRAVGRAGAR